jgi:hypothetical protein
MNTNYIIGEQPINCFNKLKVGEVLNKKSTLYFFFNLYNPFPNNCAAVTVSVLFSSLPDFLLIKGEAHFKIILKIA